MFDIIKLIITGLINFSTGSFLAIITAHLKNKKELKEKELETNRDIRLAEITAKTNSKVLEKEIKEMENHLVETAREQILKLEELQKKLTGNKIIDILNSSIRPIITLFYLCYFFPKISNDFFLLKPNETFMVLVGIISNIVGYYFTNRTFVHSK